MTTEYKKLQDYLRNNGITQLELSHLAKMSASDISQILSGKKYCFPGWRKRISEALGEPETQLFEEVIDDE